MAAPHGADRAFSEIALARRGRSGAAGLHGKTTVYFLPGALHIKIA